MNDLISRGMAYEVLTDYYHQRTELQHKALREALGRVPDAEPSPAMCWGCNCSRVTPADVPDRKVGKWLLVEYPDGYYHAECSECGEEYAEDLYWHKKARFCPCCGAELRGSENG